MNDLVVSVLRFISLAIIALITLFVGIMFAMSHGPIVAILAAIAAFIVTSIPMSIFLVLCSINDKLSKAKS